MSSPLVSVIVVNWDRRELLRLCLLSLRAQTMRDFEVIVVDNGSRDGSVAMLREEFPEAAVIVNPRNLGFCAANNQGIARARGRYIALLNNDAEAGPRWLEALLEAIRAAPDVGMCASKILLHARPDIIDKVGHLIYPDGQNRGRGCGEIDRGQYDGLEEVLFPDGCAAFYDRRVFETVGAFDEDFFAYGDDAELGLRIRLAGWRCLYVPSAVAYHHHSSTLGRFSEERIVLVERNRIWLAVKLFPWRLLVLNKYYTAVRLATNALAAIRGQGEAGSFAGARGWWALARCLLRAWGQAIKGLPRMLGKRREVCAFQRLSTREFLDLLARFRISARELAFQAAPARAVAAAVAQVSPPASPADKTASSTGAFALPACPLCGSTEARARFDTHDRLFRTTGKRFRIMACAACGVWYLTPRPAGAELASYYPERYWWSGGSEGGVARQLEGLYRAAVLRDHLRFLRRAAGPPPARILDVGCGSGDLLAVMARQGYSCLGMDCSLPALSAAARQGVAAVLGDYRRPALGPGRFDLVCMYHFLEHVPDPAVALAFARGALRPGGRLIVQVPDAASWQAALLGPRWSGLDVPRHLVNFRRADLERLVGDAGFRIRRRKHFSLRDNPAALATSLAPGLEPAARRVRRRESIPVRLGLDLAYFALVAASLPFALLEAAAGRGATITLEAEKG
jgi:GT2 family glycosyltransferase/SAM-dependent methyltransferase